MSNVQNLLRTAAEWTEANPVLGAGQTGVEKFTGKSKTGNSTSHWNTLKYNSTVAEPTVVALGNTGTAKTIPDPVSGGAVVTATLTGNCVFTMPAARAAAEVVVVLAQDATGSRTAAFTGVKWPAGSAPTVTVTATKRDIFRFTSDGTDWFGEVVGQNYV